MSDEELDTSKVAEEETDFEVAFNEHAEAKETVVDDDDDLKLDPDPDLGKEIKNEDGEPGNEEDPGKKKEEEDPYAGMSEEVKARVVAVEEENKNLNHRLDSDAGRVSAFQRKINVLEKDIQDIRQGSTTGEQPNKNQIADAMNGSDDEWVKFTEDYPEVARAIDGRLDQAGKATQESVENTLAPVKEKQARDAVTEHEAALVAAAAPVTEIYPTWTEAVKTNEFALWLDEQPPGVQSLTDSDDAQDAAALIGLYDTHLVAAGLPTLKAEVKAENVPGPGDENLEADKIAAKRKQQLEDGTTIKSKRSGIDPSKEPVDNFEAAFNYHATRKERKRANA